MPRLRRLSGREILSVFERFGFVKESQRGSHLKLVRFIEGRRQVLTVPNHTELDAGTLRALFRQASVFVPADELRNYFYTA